MTKKLIGIGAVFAFIFALAACDPPETDADPGADDGAGEVSEDGPSGIDNAGITDIPDDPDLAAEGEDIFAANGCAGCHQMERDGAGPALSGVTDRRSGAWLARMINHPDEMRDQDPAAQELTEDYAAPMPPHDLSADELEAILAYLNTQ